MKLFLIAICLMLTACGTLNPAVGALESKAVADYAGARHNIQTADDMKLKVWSDTACAVNVGALQRAASSTGNQNIVNAVFMACPVPNVGVTQILPSGQMNVQTTNVAPPAVP
jgi:hypothetical protein